MSWTCPTCNQTYAAPCFHPCGPLAGGADKGGEAKPPTSPLARVRNPQGRVDVLLAAILDRSVRAAKNPAVPALYEQAKPLVELLLKKHLGPRTRRGRKIAADLFALRDAVEHVQRARKGQAA